MFRVIQIVYVCAVYYLLILYFLICWIERKQRCQELRQGRILTAITFSLIQISMGIASVVIEKRYGLLVFASIISPCFVFFAYLDKKI